MDRLSDYQYHLPPELIAQRPAVPRDSSRLMVIDRQQGKWEHAHFHDLPDFFDGHECVVANNTRVIRARLEGKRVREENGARVEGGKVEFLMLEEREPLVWEGAFHAAAKHKPGVRFEVPSPSGPLLGEIVRGASESPSGTVWVKFDRDPVKAGAGEIPLPHYMERTAEKGDDEDYQTRYAKHEGSAAAPTAGLHFTDRVIDGLLDLGVRWEEITLHVGLGTFRPVKVENLADHVMHEERYEIPADVADRLTTEVRARRPIVAVGTTTVRTLESAWDNRAGKFTAGPGRTSLFIRPDPKLVTESLEGGYKFRVVDRLLTNFHLPQSTLLMLVSAFAGRDLIMAAYEDAVREKYRFFSYGDAMLIL